MDKQYLSSLLAVITIKFIEAHIICYMSYVMFSSLTYINCIAQKVQDRILFKHHKHSQMLMLMFWRRIMCTATFGNILNCFNRHSEKIIEREICVSLLSAAVVETFFSLVSSCRVTLEMYA